MRANHGESIFKKYPIISLGAIPRGSSQAAEELVSKREICRRAGVSEVAVAGAVCLQGVAFAKLYDRVTYSVLAFIIYV